jgi:site-specific DNA-methyltransferase (adenine-specific)
MKEFVDIITAGDCLDYIPQLDDDSIDCFLSDIPYGISLDEWDVLHANTNSALLGQSPAQVGKSGFKRRGKPIRGWSSADRNIPREYQDWCFKWTSLLFPKMKDGSSLFVFGARRTIHRAIMAFEDSGFLVKDILVWEKASAHHRAQRVSGVLENRGMRDEAEKWQGWRLGNLAPIWEPIAWLFKPYQHTITDNLLENELGAINTQAAYIDGHSPTNLLRFDFAKDEMRLHEAQKPVQLLEFLIRLTTRENHLVLDPFMGSGSTAVACNNLNRHFIGFEINPEYVQVAQERLKASEDKEAPPNQMRLSLGD